MKTGLPWLALLALLAGGCAQHSQEWDDARASCQAEAIENLDTFEGPDDQRADWEENYIRECMEKKGITE
jgi:hypothetical protein